MKKHIGISEDVLLNIFSKYLNVETYFLFTSLCKKFYTYDYGKYFHEYYKNEKDDVLYLWKNAYKLRKHNIASKLLFLNKIDIIRNNNYELLRKDIKNNKWENIKKYISFDENIDIHFDDEFIFRWASRFGNIQFIKYLFELDKHINIHAKKEYAFRWVINKSNIEMVKYLITLDRNIDIYAENQYALKKAILNKDIVMLKYLFSLYDNINSDVIEYTFKKAIMVKCHEIVEYLVDEFNNENICEKYILYDIEKRSAKSLQYLVTTDINIDIHYDNDIFLKRIIKRDNINVFILIGTLFPNYTHEEYINMAIKLNALKIFEHVTKNINIDNNYYLDLSLKNNSIRISEYIILLNPHIIKNELYDRYVNTLIKNFNSEFLSGGLFSLLHDTFYIIKKNILDYFYNEKKEYYKKILKYFSHLFVKEENIYWIRYGGHGLYGKEFSPYNYNKDE